MCLIERFDAEEKGLEQDCGEQVPHKAEQEQCPVSHEQVERVGHDLCLDIGIVLVSCLHLS